LCHFQTMASPMVCLPFQSDSVRTVKTLGFGGAQSRSTSAGSKGSTPSEGQSSVDLKSLDQRSLLQEYHGDSRGLPEYDYPTAWSIKSEPQLPEIDYPVPLVVKNTFIDFDVWRPPSLDEFYKERQTQSCPASGISLPPGLEDLVDPEVAAAKLAAAARLIEAECALRAQVGTPESTEIRALQMDHFLPSGLLDDMPSQNDESYSLFPLSHQQPTAMASNSDSPASFQTHWQSPLSAHSVPAPVLSSDWCSLASPPLPATKQAVVLDLSQALSSPFPIQQEEHRAQQLSLFAVEQSFSLAPPMTTDIAATEAVLGSPECPTVGSQYHWVGACKPCAFLHTKGCGNGTQCPFCHLCEKGEKKKRAKDKRGLLRSSQHSVYLGI